ncbi:MAG: methyltransferase domain-containing protein [candidate division Zixibacteria bacterium]|nr:methyltransferase domain-containing protein [candidate division Zixibacteria bacterium]
MGLANFLFRHRSWDLKRSDIVLDIGSGNSPIMRANILVDKYIESDLERFERIVIDRPLICADGEYLPFKDNSIDFIYCNQLLEHVIDPKAFLDELQRVGKRGLITSINGDMERFYSDPIHLWMIWNDEGKLILKQKKEPILYPELRGTILKVVHAPGFWKFHERNFDLFNAVYYWNDKIDYEIIEAEDFELSLFEKGFKEHDESPTMRHIPFRHRIRSRIGKAIRSMISSPMDLNSILCCPLCKGDLTDYSPRHEKIECTGCGKVYEIRNGIPLMDIAVDDQMKKLMKVVERRDANIRKPEDSRES